MKKYRATYSIKEKYLYSSFKYLDIPTTMELKAKSFSEARQKVRDAHGNKVKNIVVVEIKESKPNEDKD